MDPYAGAYGAAAPAAPAAGWGAPAAGAWGAASTTPSWDASAAAQPAAGWGAAAGGGWGGAAGGWPATPAPQPAAQWGGGYSAPAPWGGDAWGKGGKGAGKGGKGMRFSPYVKKGGPTSSVKVQPLPEGTNEEQIREAFKQFGEINSVRIMQGQPNYAYVNFATTAAAAGAIALNEIELGGNKCFVNPGRPKYPDASDTIGMFNIPYATTQEELDKLVGGYTGFKRVKMIMKPGTGEFRGFAFASFDSVENAITALEAMAGTVMGDKSLDIKFAANSSEQGGAWGKGKGGAQQWGGGWGGAPAPMAPMWGGQGW